MSNCGQVTGCYICICLRKWCRHQIWPGCLGCSRTMISRACSSCRTLHRHSNLQVSVSKAFKGPLLTRTPCRIRNTCKSCNSCIKLNVLLSTTGSDLALPETNGKTPVQALGNSVKGLAQVNGTGLHTTVRPMSFASFCVAVWPLKNTTTGDKLE